MPNFAYKGIDGKGKNTAGVIDAESEKVARVKLRKVGIFPTQVGVEGAKRKGGLSLGGDVDLGKRFQRIGGKDIAVTTRQLATLMGAHVPILDALTAITEQTQNTKLKSVLGAVKENIMQGGRLSDAMAQHPKVFSTLFVAMIAAGEAAGAMETVLQRLADLTEKAAALKSKIMGAMMYPIIMSVVGVGLMTFLVVYVVPQVTDMFADAAMTLPLPTRILIWVSDTISGYWYILIAVGAAVAFGVRKYLKTEKGGLQFDKLKLKLPIFGNLFRLVAVSQFARTLATMLGSGVNLLKAMEIVKNVMQNRVLVNAIEETKNSVREGESIAEPLKRSGQFPPMITHMISIGEKTGELETMMLRVADAYDEQINNLVGGLTSLLEPIMILVMGAGVGFIVMSIMIPILKMSQMGG